MAFEFIWSPEAAENYESVKNSSKQGLLKQVDKALRLLAANPKHPGLKSHIYGDMENPLDPSKPVWESYAQNNTAGAYRIFWCFGPGSGKIGLIAITPHP